MRFRPFPVLTLFSLLGLAVLLWLGNWQWQRFHEKLSVAAVEQATETYIFEPINIPGKDAPSVYGLTEGASIWRAYVPAKRESDGKTVFVQWQAFEGADIQHIPLEGLHVRELEGVMVEPKPAGPFTPPDQPEENLWYVADPMAFAEMLGLHEVEPKVFEPLDVPILSLAGSMLNPRDEETIANPYASETGGDNLPASRHLGYALTWWGLALGLIGVYLAFHMARGRLTFNQKQS